MAYDPQNVFAKILRGEAPCHKVHEDERTLAFMDIMPQADGHVLVIPKEPAETIFELTDAALADCMRVVKRMGLAVKEAFNAPGIAVVQMNGAAAGQSVPHVHFHVLPGSLLEIVKRPHAAVLEKPERLAEFAQRITRVLPKYLWVFREKCG
jgi:histidine triad (HIT) family protein